MIQTRTTLETPNASRYITRLCKHWGHKFSVDFDAQRGHIDFGGSSCELQAGDMVLHVSVFAPEAELNEMENVVAEHIQRFAPRGEELQFAWERI
ncbi:MAG: DUF2218 domain-containing protein [Halomonadaceae bacterium]|uniref:DUF2218 domain-containing protein n=1 Tax=Halomonas colorata TaxID=2742615 RepID=A0ABR9FV70_9GAMM|nr:DUF2218 domain-containing protein [Halomonas colorata]MBE0462537.1 DUF2218 domain-containing protein [Halomonas colorata]